LVKGDSKVTFLKSRLFTNVLEKWLKKYIFFESNCSCAVEKQNEHVQWTSMKRWLSCHLRVKCLRMAQRSEKITFPAEKVPFQIKYDLLEFRSWGRVEFQWKVWIPKRYSSEKLVFVPKKGQCLGLKSRLKGIDQ
jgi:hypothetical protein